MRVLVTGAGGFSGGHVARRLAVAGFEVLAVTRNSPVKPPNEPAAARRFKVIRSDLTEPTSLPDTIDAVVHAAATSIWAGVTVDRMIHDNVVATQALVNYALSASARSFIFFSSLSAFGKIESTTVTENTPVLDPDAYGVTKLLGEHLLREAAVEMPSISLRLPSVIGRGSHRNWPSETLRKLKAGEPLSYFNPDADYNNAVHEADLSALIASLLKHGLSGTDTIVLGAAGHTKVSRLVDQMAIGTNSISQVRVVRQGRAPFTIDCAKARRVYAYAPAEIDAMIERFIAENQTA